MTQIFNKKEGIWRFCWSIIGRKVYYDGGIVLFFKNIMIPKHECFTAQHDETLIAALEKLETHQIDGLPVLQGEQY